MSIHKHHHCECPHERIKYCKICCKPYCLDCGQEWGNSGYTYYPCQITYTGTGDAPYTPAVTWSDTTCSTSHTHVS